MSAKSPVIPPSKKLEKFVMATAVKVRKAANAAVRIARPAKNADRITTKPVIEPSVKPATISITGSFFRSKFSHSLPSLTPSFVG